MLIITINASNDIVTTIDAEGDAKWNYHYKEWY